VTEVQAEAPGVLNIERIYSTTIPPEELGRALADHFRAQEFETQVYRTSENRTVMQARKESLAPAAGCHLRTDRGLHPREGQLSIGLGVTSGSMQR
jgi:hypothetical protein